MTDPLHVRADEFGTVRVFGLRGTEAEIARMTERHQHADGQVHWPLMGELGIDHLDETHVEVFDVAQLGDIGLTGYMEEGLGIPAAQIAEHRALLENEGGKVLILLAGAFGGQAAHLAPSDKLSFLGLFTEDRPQVTFDPLPAGGAKGAPLAGARKPVSDAAMSGRIAMVALLVLFVLTGLVVWMAG
ncbi:MAG: hypothetical protein NWT12_05680 [Paracoccaceae bacterium]|jgi:hypothetical protein|nr:hypothetical protein [Paracoccaceae bacterium]MDP5365761.1 hypothetical protein [Paracoccaceae bacterium]